MKCSKFKKRLLFVLSLIAGGGWASAYAVPPGEPDSPSRHALELISEAFAPFDGDNVDHHVHVIGYGDRVTFFDQHLDDANGCGAKDFAGEAIYINPERFQLGNAKLYLKTRTLMSITGIRGTFEEWLPEQANDRAIANLYGLVKHYRPQMQSEGVIKYSARPGKFVLLAMDGHYDDQGNYDEANTDIKVPSRYVLRLSNCLNRLFQQEHKNDYAPFEAAVSVHPLANNAVKELKALLREFGEIKFIKWLPNAMNINPQRVVEEYLEVVKQCGMTVITHTGHEEAVESKEEHQHFGNPTLHELSLESGGRLAMAHAGYKGTGFHLHGGHEENNTELFNEMLQRYPDNLIGELSATVFIEKSSCIRFSNFDCYRSEKGPLLTQLQKIIRNADGRYSGRMINGSDYPLPGVHLLNPVEDFVYWRMLTKSEAAALMEIWRINPMLFDFVLKRTLRLDGLRLPDQVFKALPLPFDAAACKAAVGG